MVNEHIEVKNNAAARRYETAVDGVSAVIQYDLAGDRITLLHTEVPAALEGRGIGSALVRAALEDARDHHHTVVPRCPFVRAYIARHPEYRPLIDPATQSM